MISDALTGEIIIPARSLSGERITENFGDQVFVKSSYSETFASMPAWPSLALGHGAYDEYDEGRRHRDRHFRFDG